MRLLIIEDNKELAQSMKAGFYIDVSHTGFEGEERAYANGYDAVLLDLNLPDKDGIDILKFLRESGVATPVIIITARDEIEERALGLWAVLKRVQAKNDMLVVNQLRNIEDIDTFSADDPALLQAYESIRQKFDENLRDYQRLNSYLSHEQKNAIAILRTRLELAGHQEYLPELDAISESIDDVLTLSETNETAAKATVDVALVCAAVMVHHCFVC